ncbi:MAG: methylmalonyl Co-A mutase-associated GTPase MeaB [Bacteroidetes bacterium]|nr:methylmalonyl Co-A mutase-associated GTPase MeaB [Bacteroidota bacterium]
MNNEQTLPQTIKMEDWVSEIKNGNRVMLSKGITLIESKLKKDKEKAEALLSHCSPYGNNASLRISITGAPGVGKSTFIECLGEMWTKEGKQVAVLAVDPSSKQSRGSILGDKTRMENLARNPMAFIRPSPSGNLLGGVNRNTRETILLCELAGFERIIVETVGVGQSETTVSEMVDLFLLLLLPGAGDELQGIKRGIVEMADMIVINKADGSNKDKVREAMNAYRMALHLFPPRNDHWQPPVLSCSSLEKKGFEKIMEQLISFSSTIHRKNELMEKRKLQIGYWFDQLIENKLREDFFSLEMTKEKYLHLRSSVLSGKILPVKALFQLFNLK